MSHSSEKYKMQASTGPPAPSSDEDQDEQVWRDVKAETGYQSYKEYVETLEESGQRFKTLLGYLKNPTRWRRGAEISVLDIQKDGSTVTSFNSAHSDETPQTPHGLQFETDHKISTRLLQNLRSPPEDIPARIVLYSLPRGPRIHASIVETLGLGLDINPSFFESLIRMDLFHGRSVWRWLPTQMLNPVLGSNMIMIGDSIATIAQKYQRERHAPPVLVIAGFFDLHVGFSNDQNNLDEPYYRIFNDLMARKIGRGTSLFPSTVDRVLPDDLASMPSNYYLKLLSIDSYKDCYVDSEVDAILLVAVLPLLRHEILRLRSHCSMTDAVLRWVQFDVENPRLNTGGKKEEHYNMLDKNRFWLRRRLEGLQESRDNFQNLARSQNAANWLGTRTWLSQDADIREALAMARTKELEVRDYMQLQIGNLSISESRKSIQLSNQQMNEAKRGKILTILALVYVPINLATSIFGMNLQQLNQSGQNVWSFVATALVSLLVTAFFWFSLELYNSVMDYKRKWKEYISRSDAHKQRRSIVVRVGIYLGLIDGHLWDRFQ